MQNTHKETKGRLHAFGRSFPRRYPSICCHRAISSSSFVHFLDLAGHDFNQVVKCVDSVVSKDSSCVYGEDRSRCREWKRWPCKLSRMIGDRCHIPGCEDTLVGVVLEREPETRDACILRAATAYGHVGAYAEDDRVWTYQDILSEAGRFASVFQPQVVRLPFACQLPA